MSAYRHWLDRNIQPSIDICLTGDETSARADSKAQHRPPFDSVCCNHDIHVPPHNHDDLFLSCILCRSGHHARLQALHYVGELVDCTRFCKIQRCCGCTSIGSLSQSVCPPSAVSLCRRLLAFLSLAFSTLADLIIVSPRYPIASCAED